MKITNLNLNNKEDKVKLLSIIYSNLEGDLTDSETEEQINNINNSSDDSNFIFSSKNLHNKVAIKLLSLEQYNKYIENGTLDGSITKYDERVWHHMNIPHNLYIIGILPGSEYMITATQYGYPYYWDRTNPPLGKNSYTIFYKVWAWDREESLRTINIYDYYIEYLSNNKNNNNILIGANNRIRICLGQYHGAFTFGTIYSVDSINKSSTAYLSPQMQTPVYQSTKVYYRQISFPTGFRPCFSIIDNNKSANLFN